LTNGSKINGGITKNNQILLAPLDWGLGHVTRCIPIIKFLTEAGHTVVLAANGRHARVLRLEFPHLEIIDLRGYELIYGKKNHATKWKLLAQLPKILTAIKSEHQWLANQMKERHFDLVISDCRFGLHHPDAFCVFITHQLQVKSPFGKWMDGFLRKWNYRFINKFNECWVPDFEGGNNLAGELSHPATMPKVPVKYIGGLSRFNEKCNDGQAQYDLLVVLSGPEPQRTVLENIMLKELAGYKGKAALVRGLPGGGNDIALNDVDVFDHLPAAQLCAVMAGSELIISRSGYTTVMDLVRLRKKSILIPTPGQSEQEYLGRYLMQRQLCVCVEQDAFSLADALRKAAGFTCADMGLFDMEVYKEAIGIEAKGIDR
jgi:UDP-N-acetylglucosamine transferase subunit ALG13